MNSLKQTFPSEALLQQALAGLLLRIPEVSGVQILQGCQELGKDLVFFIPGGFGEAILCACVVKNSRISGEVGKKGGARTILHQAQQAFDSPHTDGSGRDINVERVYVVTPFELSPSTITSVRGALRERSGQVVFIGGSALFDLFKKHWPNFLEDEATAIEEHFRSIREGLNKDSSLGDLAIHYDLGHINVTPRTFYVSQTFYREFSSYTLGPTLTDPFLDDRGIGNASVDTFTKRPEIVSLQVTELSAFINKLERIQSGLDFLEEWNMDSLADTVLARKDMQGLLSHIIAELGTQLKKYLEADRERKDVNCTLD